MHRHAVPRRRADGLTLMELVVVVVILGFLAIAASSLVSTAVVREGARVSAELGVSLSPVALLLRLAGLAALLFGGGFCRRASAAPSAASDRIRTLPRSFARCAASERRCGSGTSSSCADPAGSTRSGSGTSGCWH
jgi:prepilin-type N-terminal cleavage/methylation domain-containing protein